MTAEHPVQGARPARSLAVQHPRRPSLVAYAATVLLLSAVLLSPASPAAAHDGIVASFPEAGSTVSVVPEEISLTFSGEVLDDSSAVTIEVIAPDGANITSRDPVVDGTTVTQSLGSGTAGVFTARWRVVSGDGHPISDQYEYTVEGIPLPTSTSDPQPTASPTPGASSTAPVDTTGNAGHGEPSGGGALMPILAVAGGVLILGGALVVVLLLGRERRRRDRAAASAPPAPDAETREGEARHGS